MFVSVFEEGSLDDDDEVDDEEAVRPAVTVGVSGEVGGEPRMANGFSYPSAACR